MVGGARLVPVLVAAVTSAACVPTTDAKAPALDARPERAIDRAVVTVIEPDATVATMLAPLVEAAGPQALFVPETSVRCPADMALVGERVCVDRWEGTIVTFAAGHESAWSPYSTLDDVTAPFRAKSVGGVIPQGYISGTQAERACRSSGKRLCTSVEWQLGCRGARNTMFPYGEERRARVCNDDVRARHPVVEAASHHTIRSGRLWTDGMNLPDINQLPDTLIPTGSREGCVSTDGLFDMVGNLHEWVADADGTFRGGYYMDTSQNGEGCSYQTTAHDFDYHDYSTGFRCCADPETVE